MVELVHTAIARAAVFGLLVGYVGHAYVTDEDVFDCVHHSSVDFGANCNTIFNFWGDSFMSENSFSVNYFVCWVSKSKPCCYENDKEQWEDKKTRDY